MDLLLDIVEFLKANSLVTGDGVDAFRDYAPSEPDDVVILHEYAGDPSTPGVTASGRSVQIVVRGIDATAVKNKAWQIYNLLDDPEDPIVYFTDTRWAVVSARQTPFKIDTDENGRILWGFNLGVVTYRD